MEEKSKLEMHLTGGNHPCGAKEEDRDASGWGKIIPVGQKSRIRMNLGGRNNPFGTKDQAGDESG